MFSTGIPRNTVSCDLVRQYLSSGQRLIKFEFELRHCQVEPASVVRWTAKKVLLMMRGSGSTRKRKTVEKPSRTNARGEGQTLGSALVLLVVVSCVVKEHKRDDPHQAQLPRISMDDAKVGSDHEGCDAKEVND